MLTKPADKHLDNTFLCFHNLQTEAHIIQGIYMAFQTKILFEIWLCRKETDILHLLSRQQVFRILLINYTVNDIREWSMILLHSDQIMFWLHQNNQHKLKSLFCIECILCARISIVFECFLNTFKLIISACNLMSVHGHFSYYWNVMTIYYDHHLMLTINIIIVFQN